MKQKSASVGLVLGVVFTAVGLATSNTAIWMLGLVFGAIGAYERAKRKNDKGDEV